MDDWRPPGTYIYWKDLLADGKVELMDTQMFGAYMFLIGKAWTEGRPPCTVPDDDWVLSRWARLSLARWKRIRDRVMAPWKRIEGGLWIQERLKRSWDEQIEKHRLAVEKGRKGGRPQKPEESREKAGLSSGLSREKDQPKPPLPHPPPDPLPETESPQTPQGGASGVLDQDGGDKNGHSLPAAVCPRCAVPMLSTREAGGTTHHQCPECQGTAITPPAPKPRRGILNGLPEDLPRGNRWPIGAVQAYGFFRRRYGGNCGVPKVMGVLTEAVRVLGYPEVERRIRERQKTDSMPEEWFR